MIALIFLLGTIVGSAITAVLWRLETGESWVRGRSRCARCKRILSPRELVPLFSWLIQRGRCLGCRKPISSRYPAIELATGVLFAFGYALRVGTDGLFLLPPPTLLLPLLRDFYAIAVLIVVFVFDMTHELILDRVTLPAIAILSAFSLALGMPPVTLALGILVGAGFFGLQYAVSGGRWIGGGDIRLGALMGALLGWQSVLVALFLAYVSGALVATPLLLRRKKEWGGTIPFGTFLSAGALVALYFGEDIIRWYVGI